MPSLACRVQHDHVCSWKAYKAIISIGQVEYGENDDGFRRMFFGLPSSGGRYSVLSNFGMVPAAVMGLDIPRFLDHVEEMVHACAATGPVEETPGAVLGIILGELAKHGRDQVPLSTSPGIWDFGAWLEPLRAESTGKDGKGVIPVDRESLGTANVYGNDRLFAYIRLKSAPDATQDAAYEKTGALPPETPMFTADGITLFTDAKTSAALAPMVGETDAGGVSPGASGPTGRR